MKSLFTFLFLASVFTNNAQQLQNSSFENFTNGNPNNWGSLDELMTSSGFPGTTLETQVSPGYSGSYAVQLQTQMVSGSPTPGFICSGPMTMTNIYGAPFTTRPGSFTFYYEFSPVSNDTAVVQAIFTKWNTSTNSQDYIGGAYIDIISPTSTYSLMNVPINYLMPNSPDTLMLIFSSAKNAAHVNTTFTIDNINMVASVGIETFSMNGYKSNAYPNPANENLTITAADPKASKIVITDLTGATIDTYILKDHKSKIELYNYAGGLYFYTITDDEKNVLHTGKFNVLK